MKRIVPLLLLAAVSLSAEEVTLKQSVLLGSDRTYVSLKPGTVVELISRDGKDVTVKYRTITGKIPASKLEEPKNGASSPAAPTSAEKPDDKKPAENKPANPPQTNYGKAVQKAKDNAAKHEKNLVKPTDEVTSDR